MTQTTCKNKKFSRGERFFATIYEWGVNLVLAIAFAFCAAAMVRGVIALYGDDNLAHLGEQLESLKAMPEAVMKYILIGAAMALGVYFISKIVGIILKDAYKSAVKAGKTVRAAVYQAVGAVLMAPAALIDTFVEYGSECAEKKAEQ